jgi:TPR repeat protein
VPQDHQEAVRWYRLAADQGYADAQYNLGVMYYKGQGVPQDYGEAHMWLNLATSRASGADAKLYAEVRDTVAGKMTPQQIAEAQRLALPLPSGYNSRLRVRNLDAAE